MATSGSAEAAGGRVTVLLYSGRPDPEWDLDGGAADALLRLWTTLAARRDATAPTPALGYRGCIVRIGPGGWHAFGGGVTHRTQHREESRADPGRRFERAALATAPPGLVPAGALPPDLR